MLSFKSLNLPGHHSVATHFGVILMILGIMSILGLILFIILNKWTQSESNSQSSEPNSIKVPE